MNKDRLAFDRASVRTIDKDGRLHVAITNISKAIVNPYLGSEIPNAEALGLDPQKVYQLLRDPAELAKAAPTFNSVPLVVVHKPSFAGDHPREIVVGTTGSDTVFEAPYLKTSLAVWDGEGIDLIESKTQQELSSGYSYVADMTPGTYDDVPYDGVMREIRGNHVALVAAGRAGPDVIVGDSKLEQTTMTIKKPFSRKAALVKGALMALKPKLAADAKLNLNPILAGITAANWASTKATIVAAYKPKMAADADIDSVIQLLDSLDSADDNVGLDDDMPVPDVGAVDASPIDEICAMLKGKISDDDMAAVEAKMRGLKLAAADEEDPAIPPAASAAPKKDEDSVSKPAMDAAIKDAVRLAEDAAVKRMRDVSAAEIAVQPWVGKLAIAMDTSEGVYKTALETLGVDVSGIHPSAFRAVLEAQPKPGDVKQLRIAQDSARPQGFSDRFPNAQVRHV
jgi:hypothetical protein